MPLTSDRDSIPNFATIPIYFRGNAPECGEYIYGGVPDVVSYVLPGSTGWNGTPGSTELPELWPVGDEFARPIDFWSAGATHTVTFDLGEHGTRTGGGELMQAVERGRAAVAPIFDVSPGWSFLGWSCDFSAVTSELTVYATYGMEPYDERAREASVMLLNGWNWVSVNVEPADAVFASVFRGVAFADNDVIKSSDGSATYSNGTWHPNPSSFKLVPGRAYAVKKSTAGTATVTVNGTTVPAGIAVAAGWNWIGPTTTSPVPIGDLVHTGGFTDGDIINSPCASATYHGGKWYGDLKALEPGSGYKARFGKAGTLR